jgi:hypothetical protein
MSRGSGDRLLAIHTGLLFLIEKRASWKPKCFFHTKHLLPPSFPASGSTVDREERIA